MDFFTDRQWTGTNCGLLTWQRNKERSQQQPWPALNETKLGTNCLVWVTIGVTYKAKALFNNSPLVWRVQRMQSRIRCSMKLSLKNSGTHKLNNKTLKTKEEARLKVIGQALPAFSAAVCHQTITKRKGKVSRRASPKNSSKSMWRTRSGVLWKQVAI